MDKCIMRSSGNYLRREQMRFEHSVLLIHEHKDDLFLNIMDKYVRYSAHVTVLITCKKGKGKTGTFYDDNLYAQYFSAMLRESVKFYPSAEEYIEKKYTAMYRPSITVTDDLDSENYLPKYCPQYYNYASNHFYQLNISDTIQGLNLAHPIDLSRFDQQMAVFNSYYLRTKACIKNIVQILPPCFVFFTAFGRYTKQFRYEEIINAFLLFKHKYEKYLGHEIMLILGGEHFETGSDEWRHRRSLMIALDNVRQDHNVIFLKRALNLAEKKALLRLSYAAIILNDYPAFDDMRFTMSLGTPIICSNTSYAANMIVQGISGFSVNTNRVDHVAACMETMSLPTTYHSFSTATRDIYAKNFSEMSMFLQTVTLDEVPDFDCAELALYPLELSNSTINLDYPPVISDFDLYNDWYVSNEYRPEEEHPFVFDEDDDARFEAQNHIEFCKAQLPPQKPFLVNDDTGLDFDANDLPKWCDNDEVCDQLYGDHLFETEEIEEVTIKDPLVLEAEANAAYLMDHRMFQPYALPRIPTFPQLLPSQPYQAIGFESYQHPSIEPRSVPVPMAVEQPHHNDPQPSSFSINKSPLIPAIEQKPSPLEINSSRFPGVFKFTGNEQQSSELDPNQHQSTVIDKSPGNEHSPEGQNKLPVSQPFKEFTFKLNHLPATDTFQFPSSESFKSNQPSCNNIFQPPRNGPQPTPSSINPLQIERQPNPFKLNTFPLPEIYQSSRVEQQPLRYNEIPSVVAPPSQNHASIFEPSAFAKNQTLIKESLENLPSLPPKPNILLGYQSPFSYYSSNPTNPISSVESPSFKTYQSPINQLYEPSSIASLRLSSDRPLEPATSEPRQNLSQFGNELIRQNETIKLLNESLQELKMQQLEPPRLQYFNPSMRSIRHMMQKLKNQQDAIQDFQVLNQQIEQIQQPNQQMQKTLNQPLMPQMQTLQQRIDAAIEQHRKEVMQSKLQSNQSTQERPIEDVPSLQPIQPQSEMHEMNQQLQKIGNNDTLQQRLDYAIQMQRKEAMQLNQLPQVPANPPIQMQPSQTLQPFQNTQLMDDKAFPPLPQIINKSQSTFSNQPMQASQVISNPSIKLPQMLPNPLISNQHILPPQTLQNRPTQSPQVLANQPPQLLQMLPNQAGQLPQFFSNQTGQPRQILPNQTAQQISFLPNQPFILLNQPVRIPPTVSNQPIPPPQVKSNQHIQTQQEMPNQQIQLHQIISNQQIQPHQIVQNKNNQAPQMMAIQHMQPSQIKLNQPIQPSQVMSIQPHQIIPNQPIQASQAMSIKSIQPAQVMPIQQSQLISNLPIQPLQVMQNQTNQSSQIVPNQQIQGLQAMPNQQPMRPFYVGIMQQHPQQIVPMQNFPRPQFIAVNQPGMWIPIRQFPSAANESQSSGSNYSTPRQFPEQEDSTPRQFPEPGGSTPRQFPKPEGRIVECEESDAGEPTPHWDEVFANDSMDEFSARGSELSETREDTWSGICSDDSPSSSGKKSWNVFSSSYRANSQLSEEMWQEGNPDSAEECNGENNGVQQQEASTSAHVEKTTLHQKVKCKECRDEKCVKELHAKVDAKLGIEPSVDAPAQKRSRTSRRREKKRRMKKLNTDTN